MDANPATAHLFIVNPLSGRALASLFSTHPPLEDRIARLRAHAPLASAGSGRRCGTQARGWGPAAVSLRRTRFPRDPAEAAAVPWARMIETSRLVKLYGAHAALARVSPDVPAGQVPTILGHNGSGKTTLVRLLATLARPTAGRGRIGGHDLIDERDDVRRVVAVVGHSTHLYDDLTPRENLAFAEALAGRRPDRGRIDTALGRRSASTARATARVRTLSSGSAAASPSRAPCSASPACCCSTRPSPGSTTTAPSASRTTSMPSRRRAAPRSVVTPQPRPALAIADRVAILVRWPHRGGSAAARA